MLRRRIRRRGGGGGEGLFFQNPINDMQLDHKPSDKINRKFVLNICHVLPTCRPHSVNQKAALGEASREQETMVTLFMAYCLRWH
jgi:hypothetical protein